MLKLSEQFAIFDDDRCDLHLNDMVHQESHMRTKSIREKLVANVEFNLIKQIEISKEDIIKVHDKNHVNKVFRSCENYKYDRLFRPDVFLSGENTLVSVKTSIGGVLSSVDTIMCENNIKKIFCNVRPPGHHANCSNSSGFCVFNNIALGVQHALNYVQKIMIIDWDLHFGDGTNSIFYNNDNVMYVSFHRSKSFYPNSRHQDRNLYYCEKINTNNVNFIYTENSTSEEYLNDFTEFFDNCDFNPDIIFISCGFDGHKDDIYCALPLDYKDFKTMTKVVCDFANTYCEGRIISVLEGGYNLDVLSQCVLDHVIVLSDNDFQE